MIIEDVVKLFVPTTLSFSIGMCLSLIVSHYLYHFKVWKRSAKQVATDGRGAPLFHALHKERETKTPKMGGIIIWLTVLLTVILLTLLSHVIGGTIFQKLDLFSRNQTWIPLAVLVLGGIVGLVDDYLDIYGGGGHVAGGLSLKKRIGIVSLMALLVALWFYMRLGVHSISLPFGGNMELGFLFIPFFVLVVVAIYSGGVIDGIDGLAGGLFAAMFSAYAGIAFYQHQINLAAFCALLVGAILAFLWFNIPPARYYMSETGSMALTITLGIVAFMTDTLGGGHGVIALPIIALPLVITTITVIIQLLSKKFRNGKKVFLIAPVHHHFEALGWPAYKVTMRYWVFGVVCGILGMTLGILG